MLIKREDLENIKAGRISLAFRWWRRPTVRAGCKPRTAVGELAIDAVDIVTEPELTNANARHADFSSRGELIGDLRKRPAGTLYRVRLRFAGPDPRVAQRQNVKVTGDAFKQIENVLRRLDSNNKTARGQFKCCKTSPPILVDRPRNLRLPFAPKRTG